MTNFVFRYPFTPALVQTLIAVSAALQRERTALKLMLQLLVGETHLLIEPHWQSRFSQSHARDGGGIITVAKLRQWIDSPTPMGLPIELQNLIILAFDRGVARNERPIHLPYQGATEQPGA